MSLNSLLLKDLLILTKDGEWGKGEPSIDRVEMLVIRGADFTAARYCNLSEVPIRYIPEQIAQRKLLQENDILIETAGGTSGRPTGRTVFLKSRIFQKTKRPITCASFSRFLRVNSEIAVPEYVFWYLQFLYETGQMEQHQVQHTGVARFQYTKFAQSIRVPLPPLPEQKAIARILGTLDDKIELNQKMNQTLEAMAQAIFKSWFVDFDPVKAKMAGRQPAGMDAATAALFPDSFQDSPLGLIPQGWEVSSMGEEFNITMGQSPPGSTYNEIGDGIRFYQGRRDFGFRYPTPRVYCNAPKRFAETGDTLVSVRAPVGDINMAFQQCCIGRGVAAIRHKQGSRSYTYYSLKGLSKHFEQYEAEGTVFGSISKSDFQKIPCTKPPLELVQEFEKLIYSIDQEVENNEQQLKTLSTLRDSLLPKLMSGEIRVN